ncbi:MAG: S-methyl-5-thioribose-1-phosphate isomerase [Gammaproteobacteria bacterium]
MTSSPASTARTDRPASTVAAVQWRDAQLVLLDQRLLPQRTAHVALSRAAEAAEAIRNMVVRGAPAIGIAAAYAVVLAARAAYRASPARWREHIEADLQVLAEARPTAINLRWAIRRMRSCFPSGNADPEPLLLAEAQRIHAGDIAACRRMGDIGAGLIAPGARLLTHCNAGALATGGYGTALGVVRSAYARGLVSRVYAGETRPWLQGARLTAWELLQDGIPVTLLGDNAAAFLMQRGGLDWVVVGADRIAANGDVVNKIGTYGLAVAARAHGLRFMVVAPASTFDPEVAEGGLIPIEERHAAEVLTLAGQPIAAAGADAWNPVFDVTPAGLIDVIVTEHGAIHRPDRASVGAVLGQGTDWGAGADPEHRTMTTT